MKLTTCSLYHFTAYHRAVNATAANADNSQISDDDHKFIYNVQ